MIVNPTPTPVAELNLVLNEMVTNVQEILGDNFSAAYLQGSFAHGGWDIHSDVDFLVVIEKDLSEAELAELQAMHPRIYQLKSNWARHLEGSYFPKDLLRREDPTHTPIYYLDNGATELIRSAHDNELVVRWVVREKGIILAGPSADQLIDPIPVDALKREVRSTMHTWAKEILTNQYSIANGWAQPFAVLSYCRMLHTLETGRIDSKPAGAMWGQSALDPCWRELIQRAREQRVKPTHTVYHPADPAEVQQTVVFIRYALDLSAQ